MFGTIDSWIIYCLTGGSSGGVHVTDVTNASRTNLMEISTRTWHLPFLELFKATPEMMPRIASNAEVYGRVAEGPLAGVPIAGCLGDQMAALLGQRAAPGEAKNTYGTGCFMLLNTGHDITPSRHGLLTTVSHQLGPEALPCYALEGSVAVAGLGISWLRDNLRIIDSADESEGIANSVPDTGGVYFVPAFGGLLAPHWEEDARGALLGMTAFTTRGHVVRAMLEAICFQTREVLEAMILDTQDHKAAGATSPQAPHSDQPQDELSAGLDTTGSSAAANGHAAAEHGASKPGLPAQSDTSGGDAGSLNLLRVDGGASHNDTLMQLQECAELVHDHVQQQERTQLVQLIQHLLVDGGTASNSLLMQLQTTALGAALAAGLTVGLWDLSFVTDHRPSNVTTFQPSVTGQEAAKRFGHWKKAVSRSLDLADLAS
eukprot:gene8276-8463_t